MVQVHQKPHKVILLTSGEIQSVPLDRINVFLVFEKIRRKIVKKLWE